MIKKQLTRTYHFIILLSMILLISCKKENNNPPDVPKLLSPDNGSLGTPSDSLKWSCTDPDGDKLVYNVYFSKGNPPSRIRVNYEDNFVILKDLEKDAVYYCSITATDPDGASATSPVWSFRVLYEMPVLTTAALNGVTVSSAMSGGNIISDGNAIITLKGVCWGANPNPTTADNKTTDGTGNDSFVSSITGLNPTTLYYLRAYATNECGTSYGDELLLRTYSSTMSDIDGNIYNTIIIGTQEWMVENLKVTKYRNGDPIPEVSGDAEWEALTADAYCNMNNDENFAAKFGRLYNWFAVNDNRNVAPAGWHIASYEEWVALINYSGGELVAGDKLKEAGTANWRTPNPGATNESGFTALPGGFRLNFGDFSPNLGTRAAWWSSSENDVSFAFGLFMYHDNSVVHGEPDENNYGFSVRCIKDN